MATHSTTNKLLLHTCEMLCHPLKAKVMTVTICVPSSICGFRLGELIIIVSARAERHVALVWNPGEKNPDLIFKLFSTSSASAQELSDDRTGRRLPLQVSSKKWTSWQHQYCARYVLHCRMGKKKSWLMHVLPGGNAGITHDRCYTPVYNME